MFQHAHDQDVTPGEKLRTLDGLEEYFWLSENTFPRTTIVLAEIEGATTVDAWRDALKRVQQRYPLLNVRIRKQPGQRPYFETLPGRSLPLRVLALKGANLDSAIANELVASFGYGDDLLARVTLFHSAERCEILLSTHHAATDGRTNLRIIQDLIAAVSGEALGKPLPLFAAIGDFFGLGESGPYTQLARVRASWTDFRRKLPVPFVRRHLLDQTELDAVRSRARAEGTTVHSALLAAFFYAGRHVSERWRTAPVLCFSPIDLRPMLNVPEAAGAAISVLPSVMHPSDNLSFWDFARQLKQGMRVSQSKESIAFGLNAVRQVVAREGDPDDLMSIDPAGFYNHDLMISNYGDTGVRTKFGDLTVRALYPSVITGGINTQSISAATVGTRLYITHISRQPFPSLVEDACAILLEACRMRADLQEPLLSELPGFSFVNCVELR
jgi:hypothetical protein